MAVTLSADEHIIATPNVTMNQGVMRFQYTKSTVPQNGGYERIALYSTDGAGGVCATESSLASSGGKSQLVDVGEEDVFRGGDGGVKFR